MALGYKPNGMEMWDTWGIERNGELHLLHLQFRSPESARTGLEESSLGHAVSKDLLHWTELAPALPPGETGSLDDAQPWTGCVYEHEGTYYLYYTMRSVQDQCRAQHIGLATSTDLHNWTRHAANPLISPDERWYVSHAHPLPNGVVDCRDLVVVDSPDGNGWYGFYAARQHADELSEGAVIAALRSYDLLHWEHLPPAFAPGKYACVEVPDIYQIDGLWYMTCLTGHGYGNRGVYNESGVTQATIYAVSDQIEGPYHEITDDYLLIAGDSTCGYSVRSFLFQQQRYVFYTERVSNTVSPPMKVTTTEAGHLRLSYSNYSEAMRGEAIIAADAQPAIVRLPFAHENWGLPGGSWQLTENGYSGHASKGWQIADLGVGGNNVELIADVKIIEGVAGGVVWRANTELMGTGGNLVVLLDAEQGAVQAGTAADFGELWRRPWPIVTGRRYSLRVIIRQPRVEVYVDDLLVLQFAGSFTAEAQPSIGLFVDRGTTLITNLAVYPLSM